MSSSISICLDNKNNILLGLSKHEDDRNGKWVFPGGRSNKGESKEETAKRELKEESGVNSCPIMVLDEYSDNNYYYVLLFYKDGKLKPNSEFEEIKWFNKSNLPKNMLGINRKILNNLL